MLPSMPFSQRAISDAAQPAGQLELHALGAALHRRCMACFIVRRKLARFSSCSAMSSAIELRRRSPAGRPRPS